MINGNRRRFKKHRIVFVVALTFLTASAGAVAGYFVARCVLFRMEQTLLAEYAGRLSEEGNRSSAQARMVLDAANSSNLPFCSNEELDYLRKILFPANFLKDIGHIRDGRIQCSATLGRKAAFADSLKPDYLQPDGTAVYWRFIPGIGPRTSRLGLQRGESYVVFGGYRPRPPIDLPVSVKLKIIGDRRDSSRSMKDAPQLQPGNYETDAEGTTGELLYATRCSRQFFNCITVQLPITAAVHANRAKLSMGPLLGGLLGTFLGLISSFAYRHTRSVEQQLRRAIRRDELDVAYQPIHEIVSGKIVAVEALARWTDEDGYAVSPEFFVRVAEERGFCGEITRSMLTTILHDIKNSLRDYPDLRINLNVSGCDLTDPDLLPMLNRNLGSSGISPSRLGIEITESMIARHPAGREALLQLRRRGHLIHIDDFGTGYSSLACLNDLPVDVLKIDKAFTQSIGTESVKVSILPQILSMAEALHLGVIVEGVETREQVAYFTNLDKPVLAQGWFYGRPMPVEDLVRLLHENVRTPKQALFELDPLESAQVDSI